MKQETKQRIEDMKAYRTAMHLHELDPTEETKTSLLVLHDYCVKQYGLDEVRMAKYEVYRQIAKAKGVKIHEFTPSTA